MMHFEAGSEVPKDWYSGENIKDVRFSRACNVDLTNGVRVFTVADSIGNEMIRIDGSGDGPIKLAPECEWFMDTTCEVAIEADENIIRLALGAGLNAGR